MSLVKIPYILVAMVGLHVTTTAPHPPPLPEERLLSSTVEQLMKQRSGPIIIKTICWSAAFAEILVILASHRPHMSIAQGLLGALALKGTEAKIELSKPFIFGTLLTALGGLIRSMCYRELGRLFTFEVSIRKEHKLVTSGPYAIVRHPGYIGVVLCVIGIIMWHAGSGSWARECGPLDTKIGQGAAIIYLVLVTVITSGLLVRMQSEDQALWEAFGEEWVDWSVRVPYRLIPGVY
ncbi:hypothetical protein H0H81_002342 [Sphagnurus paluster]|uniref:Protein-S-isoprenylcysteine O-methyltransferase n=1 Tax=Sphagnurus paluster TaxID=117069 RepID=A0A9P7K7N8_9AGAR|nr:hypothetical protein H0H81_002342 [Sphagnurus paluster]